jgi:hypothetical protein
MSQFRSAANGASAAMGIRVVGGACAGDPLALLSPA